MTPADVGRLQSWPLRRWRTITISDAGTFTFATADNEPKTVAAGAVVRFVAPAPADSSIAGIAVTLVAALA